MQSKYPIGYWALDWLWGVPMIAFSTDANVAAAGIYLLSFLPESDVDRVIDYAIASGKRSFAALVPDSAGCVYHRGLAYLEQGRLDRALADFDRALQLDPVLTAAVLGRGILHLRAKRYTEALADLRRARAACPDYPAVWFNEALVHVERADHPAAVACLRRALALEPTNAPARQLLAELEQR